MRAAPLLLTLLAFFTAVILAFGFNKHPSATAKKRIPPTVVEKKIIRCGPDWELLATYFDEAAIPPIPGSGNHKWKITTNNDSAQFYFNQGMNMYYSFHIIESMASFKKASKFDPGSAMLFWAQALAYGPNINDLGYAASPEALEPTKQAAAFSEKCTPRGAATSAHRHTKQLYQGPWDILHKLLSFYLRNAGSIPLSILSYRYYNVPA